MRRGPFRAALQQIGHERLRRGLAQLRLRPGFGTPAQEGVHPGAVHLDGSGRVTFRAQRALPADSSAGRSSKLLAIAVFAIPPLCVGYFAKIAFASGLRCSAPLAPHGPHRWAVVGQCDFAGQLEAKPLVVPYILVLGRLQIRGRVFRVHARQPRPHQHLPEAFATDGRVATDYGKVPVRFFRVDAFYQFLNRTSPRRTEAEHPDERRRHRQLPPKRFLPLIRRIPQCCRADTRSVAGHLHAAVGQMVVTGHRREQPT
jgi:hypothetical protein